MSALTVYSRMIKLSHSIFALPFALASGLLAARQVDVTVVQWALIVACMVTARSSAMGFNRIVDRDHDARNPRTAGREIPSGQIGVSAAWAFTLGSAVLFVAASAALGPTTLALAPVALAVTWGYSLTKRFTALCHLILGLGLSLAPVGAYIAVTGQFHPSVIILGAGVLTWVSGFDIIYALQDEQFDREHRLHSIPAFLGKDRALYVSSFLHLLSAACIAVFVYLIGGTYLSWGAVAFFVAMLIYQHLLVKPNDLSKVNLAFFTTNGVAAVVFAGLVISELLLSA